MPPISYILQITPPNTVVPAALGLLLEQLRQQINQLLNNFREEGCHGTRIRYRQLDTATKELTEGWWVNEAGHHTSSSPPPVLRKPPVNMNLQVLGAEVAPRHLRSAERQIQSNGPYEPTTSEDSNNAQPGFLSPKLPTPGSFANESGMRIDSSAKGYLLNQFSPLFTKSEGLPIPDNDISPDSMPTSSSKIEKYSSQTSRYPLLDQALTPDPSFDTQEQPRVLEWLGMLDASCSNPPLLPPEDDETIRNTFDHLQDLSGHKDGGCSCLPTFS